MTRFSLEDELRKALDRQYFELYYRLQVNSADRPLSADSLIRWSHPVRGSGVSGRIHFYGGRKQFDSAHWTMDD